MQKAAASGIFVWIAKKMEREIRAWTPAENTVNAPPAGFRETQKEKPGLRACASNLVRFFAQISHFALALRKK